MRRAALVLAFAAVTPVAGALGGAADASAAPMAGASTGAFTAGEIALQGRLIAPCCWTQTLDVHESEISTQLRAEIARRLRAGERAEAIEDDFAARFGERIRAVPRGKDPFKDLALVVLVAVAASALGLWAVIRRWTRAGGDVEPTPEAPLPDEDAYDARLDAELRSLEEGR